MPKYQGTPTPPTGRDTAQNLAILKNKATTTPVTGAGKTQYDAETTAKPPAKEGT